MKSLLLKKLRTKSYSSLAKQQQTIAHQIDNNKHSIEIYVLRHLKNFIGESHIRSKSDSPFCYYSLTVTSFNLTISYGIFMYKREVTQKYNTSMITFSVPKTCFNLFV